MCFSIPYKIVKANKKNVVIEDGRMINLGKELNAKKGDYVQAIGNIAVSILSPKNGEKIRKLIKSLNN